jgi:hypothetical protein
MGIQQMINSCNVECSNKAYDLPEKPAGQSHARYPHHIMQYRSGIASRLSRAEGK